jgi:multidrug resistance efflux pump
MESKKAYQEKMEAQLREWSAKIDLLKAKADKAKAEVKIKYYEKIEELRADQETARQKLQELKGSGEEAWGELKGGVDKAIGDLKEGLNRALAKFKGKEV